MEILPQLLVNALIAGSIYALASSGLSLAYGLLRVLNFAHGHLMMVGAYFFYFLSAMLGLAVWQAGIATLIFSILFGALVLRIFILPFSKFSFLLTFVTSLALANMLEAAVSMIFGVNVKSLVAGSSAASYEIGSVYITPIQVMIIVSALVILGLLGAVVHWFPLGRRIRALAQNTHAAQSIGISRMRVSYLVFAAATVLAAFSGILVGYETNMQPTMGNAYTVKAFAAMVLGGLGNLWGTVAASYILGLIENLSIGLDFGRYSIPAGYKDAFAFAIILLTLLVKPEGIFAKRRRRD